MSTFISYSRTNSDFAVRLAKDLKAAGLDIWLDQLDIPTGARWDDEIEKALEKSSTFLIILSPESTQSQNVKDEVGYAIDAGKQILPVTVKNCKIPLRLRRFQYVDFSNKSYEDSLIDIKRLLNTPSNLINESNAEHKATLFEEVDNNKRKLHKSRGLLGNMTLTMVTIIGFVAIAIVAGYFLLIKGAPAKMSVTETAIPSEAISSPTATSIAATSPTEDTTNPPTNLQSTKAVAIETPTVIPSLSPPRIYGFQTCTSLCNGQNSSKSFSERIKKIYAQFNYENFPSGVKYVRTWSLKGMEWIRYSCNWDGPTTGTEVLTLKEPQGLRSGTWEITIMINDEIILKDQITVNGNWNYWDPAGTINACHGTVD